MTILSDKVKKWRKDCKERIVLAMGGCCQICGYNKCPASLALHHKDPLKKDFNFGAIRANIKSWATIVEELRKCVLLCHNCHSELHANVIQLPENISSFNEEFADYKTKQKQKIGLPVKFVKN